MNIRFVSRHVLAAVLTTSSCAFAAERAEINRYVAGLDYDAKQLLSMAHSDHDGTPVRRTMGNETMTCERSEARSREESLDDVTVLGPIDGAIFPGALVRANRRLVEGRPDAITLPRAALTLGVNLPGFGTRGVQTVADPTAARVQGAIDRAVSRWMTESARDGFGTAGDIAFSTRRAHSSQQVAMALGFNASWAGNSARAALDLGDDRSRASYVGLFRQTFYTVTADLPPSPAAVFADGVTLADVKQRVSDSDPPAFVRSVSYGRIILVRMDADQRDSHVDAEAVLRYGMGTTTVDASASARYHNVLQNSRLMVVVLGGDARIAVTTLNTGEPKEEMLRRVAQEGATLSPSNPGVPIGYSTVFLRDNRPATIRLATQFTERRCTVGRSRHVRLGHAAGYIGRFTVRWNEVNDEGRRETREWHTGNMTSGTWHHHPLPPDAENIHVDGWANVGAHAGPSNVLSEPFGNADSRCFRLTGALPNHRWDERCH